MKHLRPIFLATLTLSLLASVFTAVVSSLHWPLVGDASLMHYVVFLMGKGLRPYKDIIDVNLPGSYLFERLAMHLFGTGALAWRLYDLALLAAMTAAAILIALRSRVIASTPEKLFAGLFAGAFFALIHMQDGLAQLGQRDLLIAALLLASYAALFTAQSFDQPLDNTQPWRPFLALLLFAALMGATLTIKPSLLPLGILLLLLSTKRTASLGLPRAYHLGGGIIALLLPPLAAVLWLFRQGIFVAYRQILHDQLPFYARLNGRPLSYLIGHSTSPVMAVCILWLLLLVVLRPRLTLERVELLTGIAIAFLAYAAQDKGLPYQRYPFLALLLILIGIDLVQALNTTLVPQTIAAVALATACLLLAPQAARRVHSFLLAAPLQEALSTELSAFGPGLSGQVQCLDTFGGCINTLYDLGLVQSTGYLSDCFLFTARQSPATALYREQFLAAFTAARPRVIVLTDQLCFGEPGGFAELDRWPQLRDYLASAYTLRDEWHSPINERWWARSEYPPRYRIYISNPSSAHPVH